MVICRKKGESTLDLAWAIGLKSHLKSSNYKNTFYDKIDVKRILLFVNLKTISYKSNNRVIH